MSDAVNAAVDDHESSGENKINEPGVNVYEWPYAVSPKTASDLLSEHFLPQEVLSIPEFAQDFEQIQQEASEAYVSEILRVTKYVYPLGSFRLG
jgi:hypothetical protein